VRLVLQCSKQPQRHSEITIKAVSTTGTRFAL